MEFSLFGARLVARLLDVVLIDGRLDPGDGLPIAGARFRRLRRLIDDLGEGLVRLRPCQQPATDADEDAAKGTT